MTMVNAFDGSGASALSPQDQDLLARRQRALGPAYRLFYETPLHIVRGDGVWLYDAAGRRYLDAYNNVASLGHARPEVTEALARQSAILNTHTRYLSDNVVGYAERLLARLPPPLAHVMFTCTGSEANDLALRIARAVTGGTGLIVTDNAYHGVTIAIAGASPSLGAGNALGEAVWTVPAPSGSDETTGERFAEGVRRAIADMAAKGVKPAALLVDTIFASDGVYADPACFLAPAAQAIRAAGGLFIADEVQAGFARVGSAFWGFARHGLAPDMVTMGKPMGNGHPIGAVAISGAAGEAFGTSVRYFNTFGGNPVSAAVGLAVLDVIETHNLAANADTVGGYLADGLRALPGVSEVRQAGLFLGAALTEGHLATAVVNHMRTHGGVLLSATGPAADALKIRPPLVLARSEADLIVSALAAALDDLA